VILQYDNILKNCSYCTNTSLFLETTRKGDWFIQLFSHTAISRNGIIVCLVLEWRHCAVKNLRPP